MLSVIKTAGASSVAVLLLLSVLVLRSRNEIAAPATNAGSAARYAQKVTPQRDHQLAHQRLSLSIPAGALKEEETISIRALPEDAVQDLDSGMINLTPQQRGYRLEPDGLVFNKPVTISLPYDASQIPAGYSAEDVYPFYFDEGSQRWQRIERVAVDTTNQLIVGTTTHFTDFINATVTVPDHPEVVGYTPTAISDLQAADPGAEMLLIEPPQASPMGDAQLTYPIDLPPGRLGMQPQLSINYTSSNSNGWLGMGWDLPFGVISIDTRWGVPRYDDTQESETYMLNGEQLTPLAHRDALQPREAEKEFHTRVEGLFRKIIRHGDHSTNYWWEVIDKQGTRFFYGGDPSTGGPVADSTLSNPIAGSEQNIYKWALRQVRDTHGNTITYNCVRVQDPGLPGGTVPGVQLYLSSIRYTGSEGSEGPYVVAFVREEGRPDTMIDCRGGFKIVTAERLKRIEVTLNDQPIRHYVLNYQEGAFSKSLLTSITQYGQDGSEFHTHEFEYYDEIREANGDYTGFAAREEWGTGDDSVGLVELQASDQGNTTALSGAFGAGAGGHIYVGFNPVSPTKDPSAGGKVGFNLNTTTGLLALVDINGDGLPDKLFKEDPLTCVANPLNCFYFRLNESGPGDDASTVFGDKQGPIMNLAQISTDVAVTASAGAEAFAFGGNVTANGAVTFNTGLIYTSDVNGDGLLDVVVGGLVLFNRLGDDGVPVFSLDSSQTPVPIGDGTADVSGMIEDYEEQFQQNIDTYPLHDTLRRWLAPFDGQIRIAGDVMLLPPAEPAETDDGVRVAVQHNGSELWSAEIEAGDHAPRTPVGLDSITVQAGDRLYFRVQSIFDGSHDQVDWDPQITYLGVPDAGDANLLDPYHYLASEDFVLTGRPGVSVTMPFDGTVQLEGNLIKNGVTTDDITLQVLLNGGVIFSETLAWDAVGEISLPFAFDVARDDALALRVRVDSPIDLGRIEWAPSLFYTDSPDVSVIGSDGSYLVQIDPPYDLEFYPANNLAAPQEAWTATETGMLTVSSQLSAIPLLTFGEVIFTVKKPGELLAKGTINVRAGYTDDVQFTIEVSEGDTLYFDYSVRDPELSTMVFGTDARVRYGRDPEVDVPAALHHMIAQNDDRVGNGLFGMPYRGWGYAGYNGNRERALQPIDEDLLVVSNDPDDYEDPDNPQMAQPAWPFCPFPKEHLWRGPDDLGWVGSCQQSSSRYGLDQIEVPREGDFAGGRAVPRLTTSFQGSAGGGFGPLSGSTTLCPGLSSTVLDYLDMNGDRFPDIVGLLHVQYTTMVGGLEGSNTLVPELTSVRRTKQSSQSIGRAGNHTFGKSTSGGQHATNGKDAPKGNGTGNQMVSLGITPSIGLGRSIQDCDLIDVNGDGLPDRLSTRILELPDGHENQILVSFNLGYGFAEPEVWGGTAAGQESVITAGSNINGTLSGAVGYNNPAHNYGFAGGAALTLDHSRVSQTLADLNGDGLPDRITPARVVSPLTLDPCGSCLLACLDCIIDPSDSQACDSCVSCGLPLSVGDHLRVAFNTGTGFGPEVEWTGAEFEFNLPGEVFDFSLSDEVSVSDSTSLGGGLYFTFAIGPLCPPPAGPGCYIIINPGFDVSTNLSRQRAALIDVNGDSYPDHVTSSNDGSMSVALNPIDRTNLLRRVIRPLGATVDMEYARDGNTTADPESRWVLSRVELFDGFTGDGVDTLVTTYRYEDGRYNRNERQFYGYRRVVEEHRDHGNADALYRTITRDYLNDGYYDKSLMEREVHADAAGNKYTEEINTYRLIDIASNIEVVDTQSTTATVFPQLIRTDRLFYEGQAMPGKQTFTTYDYDALGNVTEYFDAGDAGAQDDVTALIAYFSDPANYIVGIPDQIVVSSNGTELRRREAIIEAGSGNLLQVRQYLEDGSAAVTDLEYFPDGNMLKLTGPANLHGERYQVTCAYDPTTLTHLTQIVDSFGYVSTAAYDLLFGKPDVTSDINGQHIDYEYDAFGRVVAISGPYQTNTGLPTLSFEYHPDAVVPWAHTRHIDAYRDINDPIDTVLFTDGIGREVQTKKDGTIHSGPDSAPQDVMIVSGQANFDLVGRAVEQYYPTTESLGTPGTLNPAIDSIVPTYTEYDVLDRVTRVTIPDNTPTGTHYGFGFDRNGVQQFEITVTDANNIEKRLYRDVRDLTTGIREVNNGGAQVLWTSYEHDALKQLVGVEDDHHNLTEITYDNFGRATVIDSPDAGRTEKVYDLTGNLIAKITANLQPAGLQISYDYEFNRLTGLTYPLFPDNDVTYTYGGPGAPFNRAGRIVLVSDESGQEERFYGKLGEIVKEIKTVASDTQGNGPDSPEVYTTEYTYDTWGRLQQLRYPDDEVLTYQYDSGGLLRGAAGVKGPVTYPYIQRLEYDEFSQRAFMEMQNEVRTTYSYDPLDRRLAQLTAGKVGATPFQNVFYTYDEVGNILQTHNDVAVPPPSRFGGPVLQSYGYDDLYRLVSATGTHQYAPNKSDDYSFSMSYDTIHNITFKNQAHHIVQPSGKAIPQQKTTYTRGYAYDGPQPHAPTHIGIRTYPYDANGNQLGWQHDQNGTGRTIVWDEENRIQSIFDNGHQKTYKYDDTGERVIKRGPQGETAYVNPYFTIRNRTVATKHLFAGSTRVASKLVHGFGQGPPANGPPEINFLYFCHPDHLGSSSYVTDIDAKLYQHLQYFPFGETWVEESSNTQHTPYHYTDKELDEETGLYYHGARYYDPVQSQWLSPDPALCGNWESMEQYLTVSPATLGLYSYAQQNPLLFTDPDGRVAVATVQGSNITIKADIMIFGSAGTDRMARKMKKAIEGHWNGNWQYRQARSFGPFHWNKTYNVRFEANVSLSSYTRYSQVKNLAMQRAQLNSSATTNHINVLNKHGRSFVRQGTVGRWFARGQGGTPVVGEFNATAAHEFGHLIGLDDRYNTKRDRRRYRGNIMAEVAGSGVVQQKNINALAPRILELKQRTGRRDVILKPGVRAGNKNFLKW